MATKPAQSFENPLYSASGGSLASDMSGYTFLNPAASTGVDSLQSGLADIAAMGAVGQKLTQFELPQIKRPPAIAYSPSQKKLFVQGVTFAEDDLTCRNGEGVCFVAENLDRDQLASPGTGRCVNMKKL